MKKYAAGRNFQPAILVDAEVAQRVGGDGFRRPDRVGCAEEDQGNDKRPEPA